MLRCVKRTTNSLGVSSVIVTIEAIRTAHLIFAGSLFRILCKSHGRAAVVNRVLRLHDKNRDELDDEHSREEVDIMAVPQPPLPASPNKKLPPVAIDGHALFEFSMRMNRALKRFERRFGARQLRTVPLSRKLWQEPPRNPR